MRITAVHLPSLARRRGAGVGVHRRRTSSCCQVVPSPADVTRSGELPATSQRATMREDSMDPAAHTETIGERLRRVRIERGLTQRALACNGVSHAHISRIEAGTREASVKALRLLAARLGVSADYLERGVDQA